MGGGRGVVVTAKLPGDDLGSFIYSGGDTRQEGGGNGGGGAVGGRRRRGVVDRGRGRKLRGRRGPYATVANLPDYPPKV
jgi:hypothetical protein